MSYNVSMNKDQAKQLSKKVILITGAASDIGQMVAKAYASHGAELILLDRNTDQLTALYDEIAATDAPTPALYPLHLAGASPEDYQNLADNIAKEYSHLDGLVHAAMELGTRTPLPLYDIKRWYEVLQVNVNAPFMLTQALFELLKKAPAASVVFTLPDIGQESQAYWGAFGVSRFAVQGLAQVFADEVAENTSIRVSTVAPGKVRAQLRAKAFPAEEASELPSINSLENLYLEKIVNLIPEEIS